MTLTGSITESESDDQKRAWALKLPNIFPGISSNST